MSSGIDVLIICALRDELEALLEVRAGVYTEWAEVPGDPPYYVATLEGEHGRFRVAAARPTEMAGAAASQIAALLSERLQPRCIAMCGVCAGHPDGTDLGDVIIADRVFHHDYGKLTKDGFEGDLRTYILADSWLRAAQNLEGPAAQMHGYALPDGDAAKWWLLERLLAKRAPKKSGFSRYFPAARQAELLKAFLDDELLKLEGEELILADKGRQAAELRRVFHGAPATELPFHVQVGPIGSGNYVVADLEVWADITGRGMRKILGVEMEAAAIGAVAHRQSMRFVVAKGVMDHGDSAKNDRYKAFAARASAEVLCALLRRAIEPSSLGVVAHRAVKEQPAKSRFEIHQAQSDEWYRNEVAGENVAYHNQRGEREWLRYGDVVRLTDKLRSEPRNSHLVGWLDGYRLRRVGPPVWVFPGDRVYHNYVYDFPRIVVWTEGPYGVYPRALKGGDTVSMSEDDFILPQNYVARRAVVEQLLRIESEGAPWADFAAPMYNGGVVGAIPVSGDDMRPVPGEEYRKGLISRGVRHDDVLRDQKLLDELFRVLTTNVDPDGWFAGTCAEVEQCVGLKASSAELRTAIKAFDTQGKFMSCHYYPDYDTFIVRPHEDDLDAGVRADIKKYQQRLLRQSTVAWSLVLGS